MRRSSIMSQSGTFFFRNSFVVVPALMVGAFALAAPPQTVFGSVALEHVKDILACIMAASGLARRVFLAFTGRCGDRFAAHRMPADLLILAGIVLMHGHFFVVSAGALLLIFTFGNARFAQPGSAPSVGRVSRMTAPYSGSAGAVFRMPPTRIVVREWLGIVLTAAVLGLTEFYEYLPGLAAREAQLYLLLGCGALLACMAPSYIGDILSAKPPRENDLRFAGPETRGIRVDRRVKSVDVLENWLSLGNLEPILHATLDAAELAAGDRLIDVGCGSGRLAIVAASLTGVGTVDVLGIDATPGMVEIARSRAAKTGSPARFQVGVGESLPLPDGYADAVTSSYFLHHLPSDVKREAVREMWRVLAPGGRLVITDYARPRTALGWLASIPMRFNFYEYVRRQLGGELETIFADQGFRDVETDALFLGYITVFRIRKPGGRRLVSPPATSPAASAAPAA